MSGDRISLAAALFPFKVTGARNSFWSGGAARWLSWNSRQMDGEASAASAPTSDWEVLSQHLFDLQVESRLTACRLRSELHISVQALQHDRDQHHARLSWIEQFVQRVCRAFRSVFEQASNEPFPPLPPGAASGGRS